MGRWSGIDYGIRRIGLALADPAGSIASPATVLDAQNNAATDARLVIDWASVNEVAGFVVGLPLNMDGTDSEQTRLARRFAETLQHASGLAVELWDERLSSYQADQYLNQAATRPGRRKRLRDALAAQVILQSFLDARRQAPPAGPATDID